MCTFRVHDVMAWTPPSLLTAAEVSVETAPAQTAET